MAAVFLRSPAVVQRALQRLAPASATVASRLFNNITAASGGDNNNLLQHFQTRTHHQTSGDDSTAACSISMVKDDWRDSVESMEPEELSTEAYEGEPDCVSGYRFSGGFYTADSYSGDIIWENKKKKATRDT